jgi:Tfp pilus assembly protein PilO
MLKSASFGFRPDGKAQVALAHSKMNSAVMQNTQRHIILALCLLILANLLFSLFLIRPELQGESKEKAREEALRQEVEARGKVVKMLGDFQTRLQQSRQTFKVFSQKHLFPRQRVGSELLSNLEKISLQAGLLRNRVAYQFDETPVFGLQLISFSLPIEGSYANLRKFLNVLESRSEFVMVNSLALESDREGTGGGIRMDMNLSTLCVMVP